MKTVLKKLKYCPRTKHSPDMPLKKATPRCIQRGVNEIKKHGSHCNPKECCWFPNVGRYAHANGIKITWKLGFRCVLDE